MDEVWKTIPRYPHCEVSNTGRVRYKETPISSKTGGPKLRKDRPSKLSGFGYLMVRIDNIDEYVHVLVTESFIGPRPNKDYRADHKDENKLNNVPENLQWITHACNVSKAQNTGRQASLNEGTIRRIRELKIPTGVCGRFKHSQSSVAKLFNVSQGTIYNIWKSEKYLSKEGTYV